MNVAGYSAFEWPLHHKEQFENLGFRTRHVGGPTEVPPTPDELAQALEMIQESLDRGHPVLAWDLFVPEFGVIYGYDDTSRTLRCRDITKDGDLHYEMLGRGQVNELYAMAVTETFPVSKRDMLKGALELAVRHARTQGYKRENSQFRNGLAGYEAWIEAFNGQNVEVYGNTLHAMYVYDQRLFATEFLHRIAKGWEGGTPEDEQLRFLASLAAGHYDGVTDQLAEITLRFPFPSGGEPNDPVQAEATIANLRNAKAAEEKGIEKLEDMLKLL